MRLLQSSYFSGFFKILTVHQERPDPYPQGHLSDWSREGEERTRERTDKGSAEEETGV